MRKRFRDRGFFDIALFDHLHDLQFCARLPMNCSIGCFIRFPIYPPRFHAGPRGGMGRTTLDAGGCAVNLRYSM